MTHPRPLYRSERGCCICQAKSSSSRFTDCQPYKADFKRCFNIDNAEERSREICNACVLIVKRARRMPPSHTKTWYHVVDFRKGPGLKSVHKYKSRHNKQSESSTSKASTSQCSSTPDSVWSRPSTPSLLDAASEQLSRMLLKEKSWRQKPIKQIVKEKWRNRVSTKGMSHDLVQKKTKFNRRRFALLTYQPHKYTADETEVTGDLMDGKYFTRVASHARSAWFLAENAGMMCIDVSNCSQRCSPQQVAGHAILEEDAEAAPSIDDACGQEATDVKSSPPAGGIQLANYFARKLSLKPAKFPLRPAVPATISVQ